MDNFISAAGLEKLKTELSQRKDSLRKAIAQTIEEAKALGDLSENTEYQEAKESQAFNEGRIRYLEEAVVNAVVMSKNSSKKQVDIGSTITVKRQGAGGRKQVFFVVGSEEANPLQGRLSHLSPIGRAFMGVRKGEIIEAQTPNGKVKYKILDIS